MGITHKRHLNFAKVNNVQGYVCKVKMVFVSYFLLSALLFDSKTKTKNSTYLKKPICKVSQKSIHFLASYAILSYTRVLFEQLKDGFWEFLPLKSILFQWNSHNNLIITMETYLKNVIKINKTLSQLCLKCTH